MWGNSHLLTNHYRYLLNQAHDRDFTVILSFSTIFDKKIIFVLHKLRCLCYFCSYNSGVNCLFALMFCLITCEKIIFNDISDNIIHLILPKRFCKRSKSGVMRAKTSQFFYKKVQPNSHTHKYPHTNT